MTSSTTASGSAEQARRLELLVLVCATFMILLHVWERYEPFSFLHGDGNFYATINRSLEGGTFKQEAYQPVSWYRENLGWNFNLDPGWSNVSLGADGHTFWPKHPLVLPILHVPLFALMGYNGLLVGSVVMTVLTLWLAYRIAARYASPGAAACATIALGLAPLFRDNAYSYSNDVLYGFLTLAAIDAAQCKRGILSGVLWGLALWAKPTNVFLAAPFVGVLVLDREWKLIRNIAIGAAGPLMVFFALNTMMFGSPFVQGYQRIVVRQNGMQTLFDIRNRFGRPINLGFRAIMSDQYEGLQLRAGGSLWAMMGLVPMLRTRAGRWFVLALTTSLVAFAWFYARFEFTYARFFTPWAALAAVPAACGLDVVLALYNWLAARFPRALGWIPKERWVSFTVSVLLTLHLWFSARTLMTMGVLLILAMIHFHPSFLRLLHTVRAWTWEPIARGGRVRQVSVLAAMLVITGVGVAVARARRPRWSGSLATEFARVEIEMPGRNVHCDYFNPARQKWECATLEREGWTLWGRAIGEECRFPGDRGHWLWLHPNPNLTRSIHWDSVPEGPLRVRYTASLKSQSPDVYGILRTGKTERELRPVRVGKIEEIVIPENERAEDVSIQVPSQAFDWRQLCVDVEVVR